MVTSVYAQSSTAGVGDIALCQFAITRAMPRTRAWDQMNANALTATTRPFQNTRAQ